MRSKRGDGIGILKGVPLLTVFLVMALSSFVSATPLSSIPPVASSDNDFQHPEKPSGSGHARFIVPNPPTPNAQYWTYTYSHSDMTIFAYVNNTQFQVLDVNNVLKWSGTLNKGQHQSLLKAQLGSPGVYSINGTYPYGVCVGDHLSTYVMGYYALDYWGRGLSTLFYTYQVNWGSTTYDPHVIIFAYSNQTYVEVRDTTTNNLIWSGVLNEGQHYDNTAIDNQYITVNSTQPVSVLSYTDQGYYVPSETGRFAGKKFYTFVGNSGGWNEDLNIISYNNATGVTVKNTNTGATIWTGTLNLGEVHTCNGINSNFVSVFTNKSVTVNVAPSPYGIYANSGYYHSDYSFDASGVGVGKLFYHPAIANGQLIVFAYEDNAQITITASNNNVVWSGTLNKGQYKTLNSIATVYKISSTKLVSVLFDWGNLAGADFAPMYFALLELPLNVTVTASPKIIMSQGTSTLFIHVTDTVTSVAAANITVTALNGGTVNPSTGLTNFNGNFVTTFYAPTTDVNIVCDINVTASKSGYIPGYGQTQIQVNSGPTLLVYAASNPNTVYSGGTSNITIHVTDGTNPVQGAAITLTTTKGTLAPTNGFTNSNGDMLSQLTAPIIPTNQTVCIITADATYAGFNPGQGQTQVIVNALTTPTLMVYVTATPSTVNSTQQSTISVHVTDGTVPIDSVDLFLTTTNGTIAPSTGLTNPNGDFTATFTAPSATNVVICPVDVVGTKAGYNPGQGQTNVVVNPPPMFLNVSVAPSTVFSGESSNVTVMVTDGTMPLDNVMISLLVSQNGGVFQPPFGQTNSTGIFMSNFTATFVASPQSFIITANGSKFGYMPTKDNCSILVLPLHPITVTAAFNPSSVQSAQQSTLTVNVKNGSSSQPIQNAKIDLWLLPGNGTLNTLSGYSDSSGNFVSTYTAPTVSSTHVFGVTVNATKSGYSKGTGFCQITVSPTPNPTLYVTLSANPSTLDSGQQSTITIHVTDGVSPVTGATIALSDNCGGSFGSVTDNGNGDYSCTYTAPMVTAQKIVSITATATKSGYTSGQNTTQVTVNPMFLAVTVNANPSSLTSGLKSTITIHVSGGGKPITGASIILSDNGTGGSFSVVNEVGNGDYNSTYTTPTVTSQTVVTIKANASRPGYISGEGQAQLTVNPAPDLPDLTLAAADITFSITAPVENDTVGVTATIHNNGVVDASNVVVRFYCDGVQFAEKTVSLISHSCQGDAVASWKAVRGTHMIKVVADPDNAIQESNEANNEASKPINVAAGSGSSVDLSISTDDITFSNPTPVEGNKVTISAVVHNIGQTNAANVHVKFYSDSTFIGETVIASIDVNQGTNTQIEWTAVKGTHTIKVRAEPLTGETNTADNEATKNIVVSAKDGEGGGQGSGEDILLYIAVALAAAGVFSLFFIILLLAKRKKKREEEAKKRKFMPATPAFFPYKPYALPHGPSQQPPPGTGTMAPGAQQFSPPLQPTPQGQASVPMEPMISTPPISPPPESNVGINCPRCGKPNDSWDTKCFWCGTQLKNN